MKYDLSKLSKNDINTIIKSLPPKFAGIYCYAPSHENKVVEVVTQKQDGIIELYDNENKLHDKWGEYDIAKNSLFVMVWDQECYWKVGVYLYEDHFEIPKYKDAFIKYETTKNFINYRKVLNRIFSNLKSFKNSVTDSVTNI